MIRASLIFAATMLITSAWAVAGETLREGTNASGENSVAANTDTIDALLTQPYFETANPDTQSVTLPSVAAELDDQVPDVAGTSSPVSDGYHNQNECCDGCGQDCQHFVCGNHCAPCICRFDHAAECATCVTNEYCRHCCPGTSGQCHQADDRGGWLCDGCGCDVQGRPSFGPDIALRFGWWGVATDGDPVKVGEFQDLESSPFWDLDGVWTDGWRTLDLSLSGLDNEANDARAYYYGGPGLAVKFEYNRFLRGLDHEPLSGFDLNSGPPAPSDNEVGEDLNVGEDYAIRVQQLDARFQGRLTNNLKWKLNLWGMRKFGERQANAMAHCFNVNPGGPDNNTCHVLSQRQSIDWTTAEIEPVVEARIGGAVVEYSRTMRAFGQSDQAVDRTYTRFDFSPASGVEGPPFLYAFVPENFTQVDRLKASAPVNECNQLYANLYLGDTENTFRDTHRGFYGYDLRLINSAIDGMTFTAYGKVDAQNNEIPTVLLTSPPFAIGAGNPDRFEPGSLRHPLEYNLSRFGLKGAWHPASWSRLSVTGGYEYFELARDFADYETLSGPFTQPDTKQHRITLATYTRWSPELNTFVRYQARFIEDPLIGVRESDGMFNTNQPEQEHPIEIGGTWMPSPYFMASAQFGVENRWHHSAFADFDEDDYPFLCTIWLSPMDRLALTGGYGYFSNWIDQDITIGFQTAPTERTQWSYAGENHFFSIGANYAWTPSTQLVGGIEWNRGSNIFSVPLSPAGADWSLLPFFSDVIVETTRIHAGIDHQLGTAAECYVRYVHFDYEDESVNFNSGTADMFLAGLTLLR